MMNENGMLANTAENKPAKEKKKRGFKGLLKYVSFLLLVAAVAVSFFLYYQTKQQLKFLSSPEGQMDLSQQEIQNVINRLGKLTLLPNEDPIMATIIDSAFLATQSAFYLNAENGDKLVVFPEAQKAYIYSPTRNIIVNAGPLINNQSQQEPVTVEIRNGTTTPGAAAQLRETIEGNGIEVTAVTQAANTNYRETQVISLSDKVQAEQLQIFAQNLNAQVAQGLPPGESSSQADILIIIGETAPTIQASPVASPSPTQ